MASTRDWFESVAEAQRRARKRLPASVYLALLAGSEAGATLDDNTQAFRELGFLPRIADLPHHREQATTIAGQPLSMPILCSPTGVQAVHPDGEVAVARAAAAEGTGLGLSAFGSKPIEDVTAANDKVLFQTYWVGDNDALVRRMDRAKTAGAKAIIITLDWCFDTRRDWGAPPLPERLDLRTMAKFAPQALRKPRWLAQYLRRRTLPALTIPNLTEPGEPTPTFFQGYGQWMHTPTPTWHQLAWLRTQWDGPFILKGITHPDDARRAADIGATAISVSNHGGNNLDTTPAAIRALPAITQATHGTGLEILLDGGIRRGSDITKALALGAHAVLIGRPYLWGLAANGETGVRNILQILSKGIDETLMALGKRSIHDLTPDDVLIPDGFTRGISG